jgi:phenylalanyl-tRNA synthetase alpha chain
VPDDALDPISELSADRLTRLRDDALAAIAAAGDLEALAGVGTEFVKGRSAPLVLAKRSLGALPAEARRTAGQAHQQAAAAVADAFAARQTALEAARDAAVLVAEAVDVTLPTQRLPRGARHPLELIQERIADIFVGMGWEVAEGPEVEASYFNFDALNIPADHPARELQDTLYVAPLGSGVLLRSQTSPVQIRTLLNRPLPVYVVSPGKVFRSDTLDATHSPVFHQLEGLVVDRGITLAHLRGTLDHLATELFGPGLRTRLRSSYFPFTEPSAEMDLQCFICGGTGRRRGGDPCTTCKGEGWVEWGGCGLVNPAVLATCGVDPEEYSGFAFGMGIDRTVMALYGIDDIRDLAEGDVRVSLGLGAAEIELADADGKDL